MKVFRDIISNDIMFTDRHEYDTIFDGLVYRVKVKQVITEVVDNDLSLNNITHHLDVITLYNLAENDEIDKKVFLKNFDNLTKDLIYLKRQSNASVNEISIFMKLMQEYRKFNNEEFAKCKRYLGASYNVDAGFGLFYYDDFNASNGKICFIKDALVEVEEE